MLRLVLDVGVLVAAAITPAGVCGQLLRLLRTQGHALIVSPALLSELDEVLLRPKFRRYLTAEQARGFVALITRSAELMADPEPMPGLTPDPDDDYLVTLARAAGADYLASGDPHLTGLTDPHPPVITPAGLLGRLREPDDGREPTGSDRPTP